LTVEEGLLPGLKIISPKVIGDQRGSFMEGWHKERYQTAGLPDFVQFNVSVSAQGVLRGLHGQNPSPQGKLIMVLSGTIWDVAVDLRSGSPTFGQWQSIILDDQDRRQFYIPPGMLHGFEVLSGSATVAYLTSDHYDSAGDFAVKWDDPEIGVAWPKASELTLSQKDQSAPLLRDLNPDRLIPFI
jgi:dTDP-4-dehydrorhamnose 3,5-epimerase